MEAYGIIAIAIAGLGFAGVALALGIRNGTLRVDRTRLGNSLVKSELERSETRGELDSERQRSADVIEGLRDDLTDMEDLVAMCSDPALIHDMFDGVLQKAARRAGGPS